MDKIEVSQRAREKAFDAYMTCFETVPNDLWLQALLDGKHDGDEMAQAFARFERDILATRTDATPVAWMYVYNTQYVNKLECTPKRPEPVAFSQVRWTERQRKHWTETPLYTHPPATDVAALVEAAKELVELAHRHMTGGYGHAIDNTLAALAPFTKGRNDD